MNKSQRNVLRLLEAAGSKGATTSDLVNLGAGNRFGGRIEELRKMGFEIRTERERQSSYRYTLVSEPEVERGVGSPGREPPSGLGLYPPAGVSLSPGRLFDVEPESDATPHWQAA